MNTEALPEDFAPADYLLLHPDVHIAKVDPVEHYLYYGRGEGRRYTWEKNPKKEILPGESDFHPIPVVIISFNRGNMLRKVISSYLLQRTPIEIFVHDNGSNDAGTIKILEELEREGIRVFRCPAIKSADELNNVAETIDEIFSCRPSSPYVVTDCDVDLTEAGDEAISTYIALLNKFSYFECAGPMLRIDDIRKSYPLFGRVMNLHIRQFWGMQPQVVEVGGVQIAYIRARIDTTFAVHRSGQPFRRLKSGGRVYAPFSARHLDWYPHEVSMEGKEQNLSYQNQSSGDISHWGNREYLSGHCAEVLEYQSFKLARRRDDGEMEVLTQLLSQNPP